jgi:ATP-dependent protease ClpP protease subunit
MEVQVKITEQMVAAEAELAKLAKRPQHDFTAIGDQIAATLLKAAEDQVTEANNLLDSVKVLAEGVAAQLEEHAKLLNDMNERMRAFGKEVVEAHYKYLGNGKHENPSP